MIEEMRREDPFRTSPSEEELKAELVEWNQKLAAANSAVGVVVAEQRHAAHKVGEIVRQEAAKNTFETLTGTARSPT